MKISMKNKKQAECTSERIGKKTRNDIIFISALFFVIALIALSLLLFRRAGDTVVVTVDGELLGEYSLSQNTEFEIRQGDGYNVLVIEEGKAYIKNASCPDGICSSHRPVSLNGESIICLPNKVVVEVRAYDKDQPDIIT